MKMHMQGEHGRSEEEKDFTHSIVRNFEISLHVVHVT